jgi:hypothetical protein
VNILVTSARMPFALDEIRKLGRAGHRVLATDSIYGAPGAHSRWVHRRAHVAAPAVAPGRFLADVRALVRLRRIELLVPAFEEVFYLAYAFDAIGAPVPLFAPGFAVLARLHHKGAFNGLLRALGLCAPRTTLVSSRAALTRALVGHARYFARPAWSRGGLELLTNEGPLAGTLAVADCSPTPEAPWIVQDYVDGDDICSFSVARAGHVVAHCAYVHPRQLDQSGGIVFESIVEPATLDCAERVVAATGYEGQISIDFHRLPDGTLVALECNPRPTAGVHLMPDDMFVDALLGPPRLPARVVRAGVRRQYSAALVRELLLHPAAVRAELGWLCSAGADVYGEAGDRVPALFQILSYAHVLSYRLRHRGRARGALKAAQFEGITWSGEPLAALVFRR